MSMPIMTLPYSASNTGVLSHTSPPENNKNSIREPSFSSYLNGADETCVLKLRGTSFHGKKKTEDTEIDVFDAEKYFNEGLNHSHSPNAAINNLTRNQLRKNDPMETFVVTDPQPRVAPQSIYSDSSRNSRSGLLHVVPKDRKTNKKSFLARIGCKCSCSDKSSVAVDDYEHGDKKNDLLVRKSKMGYNSVEFVEPDELNCHFSFPLQGAHQGANMEEQKKPAELSGTEILESWKNSLSVEEKVTMLTWDGVAPGLSEKIKIPLISSEMNDENDSDASSELFEIETLSNSNTFLTRQTSVGVSKCYAPSEASIEWSVVTASAADFSALSDYEELRSTTTKRNAKLCQKLKHGQFKEMPNRHTSIFSGCTSHKAVRVAGDAHRANEMGDYNGRWHLRPESFTPMTRIHD